VQRHRRPRAGGGADGAAAVTAGRRRRDSVTQVCARRPVTSSCRYYGKARRSTTVTVT
jgi:hypothetical protein